MLSFTPTCRGGNGINFADAKLSSRSLAWTNSRAGIRLTKPFEHDSFRISRISLRSCRRVGRHGGVRMAMVDERLARGRNVADPPRTLAYELVQGALVNWRLMSGKSAPDTPTAILLHGILGSRKNWGTFARRLAREFPTWQFLLVDLRCHGDSASINKRGPHTVASTALDVLKLIGQLRLTPRVLVGHSFGGKVVLSMVDQAAKPLARPVRVWVLDATPGKVRSGGDGEDHPAELICFLSKLPKEVRSY
ncbi:hypothetical protein SLEP1_g20776 [Rubroshorea leprosula]|uniref:AB hydrolase-1 domain-containing protein n=1 Tax=Rubroshorea leprosula TaxID=152421 RepID=A0AAV5J3S8_9ROSI|nr:hypothetical protein SLEP1_g20776 [Rubroshorea leprosula]